MRAAQTLAVQREAAANVKDLRLPAISVGSPTLCPSSLRLAGQFCAAIVSGQIAPRNREPIEVQVRQAPFTAKKRSEYEHAA
jgi:hypothetical protein